MNVLRANHARESLITNSKTVSILFIYGDVPVIGTNARFQDRNLSSSGPGGGE